MGRTGMKANYVRLLVPLHEAQVKSLDEIRNVTGKNRVELIREAVALLIGRYLLAEKGGDDAKVA